MNLLTFLKCLIFVCVYFQKNVVPQMQSLSQMFDKAGGGYDCQSTNCNENDVSTTYTHTLLK